MDDVRCLGLESSILECNYDHHTADCTHGKDVGVVCYSCESRFFCIHLVIIPSNTDPKPDIKIQRSSNHQFVGNNLNLTCLVSVSTDQANVIITWYKDDIEYRSSHWDTRISITLVTNKTDNVFARSLIFSPLELRDSGTYHCTVLLINSLTGSLMGNSTTSSTNLEVSTESAESKNNNVALPILIGVVVVLAVMLVVVVVVVVVMVRMAKR